MPTYEYQCNKCGLRFEEYQSITADPLTKCKDEQCDGSIKRLFSAGAGFLFKGSGFYSTDYRSESYKKAASSDSCSTSSVKKSESSGKPSTTSTSSIKTKPSSGKKSSTSS